MNVPKLRFKEFNDEWQNISLNKLVNFSKGNLLSKTDLDDQGLYSCILYGQLYTKYSEVIRNVYSKTNRNDKNLIMSKYGDVLIPSSGETPIDISTASCIMLDNIILGGDINILSPKNCDGRFLSYMINNTKRKEIAKLAQGHSVVHLYNDNLKKININIPQLNEQNKIADTLELLDKKIELQTKKIEDLKLFKKGLLNLCIKNIETMKVPLKRIIKECSEKSISNNQYDILSSTANGLYLQKEYFNKQAASENNIGYKIIKKGQLVLSPQNLWMGNININRDFEYGIVSPSYKVFDINQNIVNVNYFDYWIKSPRALYEYMISSEQGASIVRRNLNMDLFFEIMIEIPSKIEQDLLGNQIKNINKKIELETIMLNKLNELKKGLMQNMFV